MKVEKNKIFKSILGPITVILLFYNLSLNLTNDQLEFAEQRCKSITLSPVLKSLVSCAVWSFETTGDEPVVGDEPFMPPLLEEESNRADERTTGRSLGLLEATHSSCLEFHCM